MQPTCFLLAAKLLRLPLTKTSHCVTVGDVASPFGDVENVDHIEMLFRHRGGPLHKTPSAEKCEEAMTVIRLRECLSRLMVDVEQMRESVEFVDIAWAVHGVERQGVAVAPVMAIAFPLSVFESNAEFAFALIGRKGLIVYLLENLFWNAVESFVEASPVAIAFLDEVGLCDALGEFVVVDAVDCGLIRAGVTSTCVGVGSRARARSCVGAGSYVGFGALSGSAWLSGVGVA